MRMFRTRLALGWALLFLATVPTSAAAAPTAEVTQQPPAVLNEKTGEAYAAKFDSANKTWSITLDTHGHEYIASWERAVPGDTAWTAEAGNFASVQDAEDAVATYYDCVAKVRTGYLTAWNKRAKEAQDAINANGGQGPGLGEAFLGMNPAMYLSGIGDFAADPDGANKELKKAFTSYTSPHGVFPNPAGNDAQVSAANELYFITKEFGADDLAKCPSTANLTWQPSGGPLGWQGPGQEASITDGGILLAQPLEVTLPIAQAGTYELFAAEIYPSDRKDCVEKKNLDTGNFEAISCPYVIGEPVSFKVLASDGSASPNPSESAAAPGTPTTTKPTERPARFLAAPRNDAPLSSYAANLHRISARELINDLPAGFAYATVLVILLMFPAELLNRALDRRYRDIVRAITRRFKHAGAPQGKAAHAKSGGIGAWLSGSSLSARLTLVTLAAVIAGLADPRFGPNIVSLRTIAAGFVTFLLLNVGIDAIVQRVEQNSGHAARTIGRPWFLLVVAASVLFSRLNDFAPTLVFGSVVATELLAAGLLVAQVKRVLWSTGLALLVAIVSVLAYSKFAAFDTGWELAATELLAALCVQSIGTLPIVLAPLPKLSGHSLWEWNKWVWLGAYAIALTAYLLVLVPVDFSWQQINQTMTNWFVVYAVYFGLAILAWVTSLRSTKHNAAD